VRRLLRPAVIVAVGALALRVDPVLAIAAGLAMWGALSWWLPARSVDSIEVARVHPSRVFHGEHVDIGYEVRSARRVPWLAVIDVMPFDLGETVRWVTSLERNGAVRHTAGIEATRRGLHRLGPTIVNSGDTFAGRTVQGPIQPSTSLLVYPRLVPIERLGLTARALEQLRPSRRPLMPDPTRVVGVRDYVPGDSLRSIHWSATARVGTLQTKKYRPGTSRTVLLAVDLSWLHHPAPGRRRSVELSVTAAASIAHHLMTTGQESVSLRVLGTDAPSDRSGLVQATGGRGPGHLANLLEYLARAQPIRGGAPEDLEALLDPGGLPFGAAVVLCTGVPVEGHVIPLERLRRLGFDVSVVSTAGDRHRSEWSAVVETMGIPVIPVSHYEEMELL
jgi:uncharacterized protein (DUF58 family)